MQLLEIKENKQKFDELEKYIESQDKNQGILMQTMHKAQNLFGYLPIEVQKFISVKTGISMAEIYGVATFYSQFSLEPKGEYTISVCMGTACYVKGSQQIIDKIKEELNVEVGKTTEDGRYSLVATRCVGCCGLAPVMDINGDVFGKVEAKNIAEILKDYK